METLLPYSWFLKKGTKYKPEMLTLTFIE